MLVRGGAAGTCIPVYLLRGNRRRVCDMMRDSAAVVPGIFSAVVVPRPSSAAVVPGTISTAVVPRTGSPLPRYGRRTHPKPVGDPYALSQIKPCRTSDPVTS